MGKGRNNRHRKRRREQSRNAKRENKKEKKYTQKKQKKKNKRRKEMTHSSKNVKFIKMGMSARFLIEPKYAKYTAVLKGWHEDGIITNLTFLAFGKWNSRTRKRLLEILKENGNEWAWNHLVFKLSYEFKAAFILRNIRCFRMSHYVDIDKDNIELIVMSNHYKDVKMFYWHDNAERGWSEMKSWLRRHNPVHFSLKEPGISCDSIIQTGVMAEPEIETHTSDGFHDNSENHAWLGLGYT